MMLLEEQARGVYGAGGPIEAAEPVASLAKAPGCHLSPVARCRCRSSVAAAGPDRAGLARGGDHVAVWWRWHLDGHVGRVNSVLDR
jgi:hypothetical protein